MIFEKFQKRWARFWMTYAGLSISGRIATTVATWFSPPYKGRVYLAHLTKKSYVSSTASIYHRGLHLDDNVFIGDRVIIYQAANGGAVKIGEKTHLHNDIIIETGEGGALIIGTNTHIQPRCQFSAYKGNIEIGSNVQIAPFCAFYPYNHLFKLGHSIKDQDLTTKGGIAIDDDAWIGVGAIILDGVRIGKGAVVGAGSVVTHDIPDQAIVSGVPAQIQKMRKDLSL